jgi:hypothetical protein
VERDDQLVPSPGLLQTNVAATVTDDLPVVVADRLYQALAGDDRLESAHAEREIERRMTPLSSGSPP